MINGLRQSFHGVFDEYNVFVACRCHFIAISEAQYDGASITSRACKKPTLGSERLLPSKMLGEHVGVL